MKLRIVTTAIVRGDLNQDVVGIGLCVIDEDVEVATAIEDAGVDQLELGLSFAAPAAFFDHCRSSVDLPMPASPSITPTNFLPAFSSSIARTVRANSSSWPIIFAAPAVCVVVPVGMKTGIGLESPFKRSGAWVKLQREGGLRGWVARGLLWGW